MIAIVSKSEWTPLMIEVKEKKEKPERMEEAAKAVKNRKDKKQKKFSVNVQRWVEVYGVGALADLVQGMMLSNYEQIRFPKREREELEIELTGIDDTLCE